MKRKVLKIFCFSAIFIAINSLLSFVLTPVSGASEVMWEDYYKMENLDTLYIGSSVCLCSFNPYILDEELGTNSYNMGTPAQPIDLTYLTLKSVFKEHDIKKVYFGFGYFALTTEDSKQAKAAFLQARNRYVPFGKRIQSYVSYIFDKKNIGNSSSINFLFPWVYNRVSLQREELFANVIGKVKGKGVTDARQPGAEKRTYLGRGFGYYEDVVNYDTMYDINSSIYYYGDFKEDSLEVLSKICEICEENEVELIVINTPRPRFDVLFYGEEYYTKYEQIKSFLTERGAKYYDFNLVKPEIFERNKDYYYNFEHLNKKGSDAFCKSLAKFEKLRMQSIDMEEYFYNWEEFLER